MFTVDDTVDATTPYRAPSAGGAAKLAAGESPYEQPYNGYPQYAQTMYQEPNMTEVGYGAGAAPLLSPFGSDGQQTRHNSMQSGGPFSDSRQGSGPWPGSDGSYPLGSDGRQSFSQASAAASGMGMAYASGPGTGYGSGSASGPGSGYGYTAGAYAPGTSEKSVPAHQRSHRVEHEQDAGGLPMPAEDVERLPPTYNPHWLDDRSGPSSSAGPAVPVVGDAKPPIPTPQASVSGERALPAVPGSQSGAPGSFQPPVEKH